jgi:DNA adenine methylase
LKTLLRYPGGKSRAVKTLNQHLPSGIKEICSPFFGGGSFELFLAEKGIKVYGYDTFTPLVDFWQEALTNASEMADIVSGFHPLSKERFYALQKQQANFDSKIYRAASFYVLNRCSFSGSTLSGGMSPNHPRFNENAINRLREFSITNLSVDELSFEKSIPKHNDLFLYLDPPYYIENYLYGTKGDKHKNFNHEGLAELLKKRKGWILSYNNCGFIKDLYKDYEIVFPEWSYGMSKDKKSKEILVINY